MQSPPDFLGLPPLEDALPRPPAHNANVENIVPLFAPEIARSLKAELRARIAAPPACPFGVLAFGDPRLDCCFPQGGLARGHWHEIGGMGLERETPAAAAGFAARLAQSAAGSGVIVWALLHDDLYAPGLAGLDPDKVIFVRADKDQGVLAVMESAARTIGVGAVIGEAAAVDLTAGRRLQLACEHHGATAFVLRRRFSAPARARGEKQSTEMTRWRIAPAPSATDEPGLGLPRWRAHLERSRNGRTGAWILEAHNAADEQARAQTGAFTVVAELADHTPAPGAGRTPRSGPAWSGDHDPARQRAAPGGG
jgi:protein ImuA